MNWHQSIETGNYCCYSYRNALAKNMNICHVFFPQNMSRFFSTKYVTLIVLVNLSVTYFTIEGLKALVI